MRKKKHQRKKRERRDENEERRKDYNLIIADLSDNYGYSIKWLKTLGPLDSWTLGLLD